MCTVPLNVDGVAVGIGLRVLQDISELFVYCWFIITPANSDARFCTLPPDVRTESSSHSFELIFPLITGAIAEQFNIRFAN